MNWLYDFEDQKQPRLGGDGVDCDRCQVRFPLKRKNEYSRERKCCEFSPFVSAFALGSLLSQGHPVGDFYKNSGPELVLTRIGVVHSQAHRKNRALCHFYDLEKKRCQIWSQRPATCLTFFCVSEDSAPMAKLEMRLLEKEAELLSQWYHASGGQAETWAAWGLSMDPEPLVPIPEAMKLNSWDEAEALYRSSLGWLRSQRAGRPPHS